MGAFSFHCTDKMPSITSILLVLVFCAWLEPSEASTNSTDCPLGWINAHDEGCFKFLEKVNLTWMEAMLACEKVGGYLAEPKTLEQMEFLTGIAWIEEDFYGIRSWWIGLSDVGHEGLWTWVHSNEEASEFFWKSGSPNNQTANALDCGYVELLQTNLLWGDLDCRDHNGSIAPVCQRGDISPTCPDGWSQHTNSCYWLSNEALDWNLASTVCQEMGANLSSSNSESENDFLYQLSNSTVWLGGSDSADEGVWIWTDGSPFDYDNWHSGYPSGGEIDNCLHMGYGSYYRKFWFDDNCFSSNYFICEIHLA